MLGTVQLRASASPSLYLGRYHQGLRLHPRCALDATTKGFGFTLAVLGTLLPRPSASNYSPYNYYICIYESGVFILREVPWGLYHCCVEALQKMTVYVFADLVCAVNQSSLRIGRSCTPNSSEDEGVLVPRRLVEPVWEGCFVTILFILMTCFSEM